MNTAELNVLLVDDEPLMLRILSRWLDGKVAGIRLAADGEQALRMIEAECPDVIITDWEMPRVNGLELCRAVRELDLPHYVYIFFLTARNSHEEIIAGLETGANDFLAKPIHQGELIARLRAGTRVLELERRLSRLASTDPLTGLFTQRTFYEHLEKEWARARRFRLPLSCVMIDLDYFKRINDTHGHLAGDTVLRSFAELLRRHSRQSDIVCRYGGEEFCALLPETNEEQAGLWADRLRRALADHPIDIGEKCLTVTASFGAAQRYDDTTSAELLVDLADQALLTAKRAGRDRVVRFAQLAGETDLESAESQEALFRGVLARHVMTPLVACVHQDEIVGQAADFLLRLRLSSTPVVDDDGKLVGILSDKDLMAAIVSLDSWQRPAREIMKPNVICYEENTPVRTIYEFLCRVSLRRVVITNEGRPTGAISRSSLIRWFRNLLISRGLLTDYESWQVADTEPQSARRRIAETSQELAELAARLAAAAAADSAEDIGPLVIGSATGMQSLVTDLLAYSRYVSDNSSGLGAMDVRSGGISID